MSMKLLDKKNTQKDCINAIVNEDNVCEEPRFFFSLNLNKFFVKPVLVENLYLSSGLVYFFTRVTS